MSRDPNIQPENSIGHLIGQAGRALKGALMGHFREMKVDLSPEQWIVLMHLKRKDGQNQASLGKILGHNKTTVTRAIDGLEKRNLVLRVPDQNDRRNNLIYLTHKGKEFNQALEPAGNSVQEEAVKNIDREHLEICRQVLRQIFRNLQHHI